MNRKAIIGACIVGGISLFVYICALMLGVNYNELFGVTLIQVAYILVVGICFIVTEVKKIRAELEPERIPIRVQEYEREDEKQNTYDRDYDRDYEI